MQIEDAREALGINTRVELAGVDRLFRDRKVRELMLAGVTIEKPETVTIDSGVTIGIDTVIEPFAHIVGRHDHRRELPHRTCAIVQNSEIGDGVEIGSFSIIGDSRLERGVHRRPVRAPAAWATMWRQGRTSATSWS